MVLLSGLLRHVTQPFIIWRCHRIKLVVYCQSIPEDCRASFTPHHIKLNWTGKLIMISCIPKGVFTPVTSHELNWTKGRENYSSVNSPTGRPVGAYVFMCCKRALSSPTSRTSQVAAPAAASSWRLAVRRQFHASLASFLSDASSGHTSSAAAAAEVARRAITDCSRTTWRPKIEEFCPLHSTQLSLTTNYYTVIDDIAFAYNRIYRWVPIFLLSPRYIG